MVLCFYIQDGVGIIQSLVKIHLKYVLCKINPYRTNVENRVSS